MIEDVDKYFAAKAIELTAKVMSAFSILQGVGIIVGGDARWTSASYKIALTVPGAPPTWGFLILIPGVFAMIGLHRSILLSAYSFMLCSAWEFFFALAFIFSAVNDQRASLGGFWTHTALGSVYAILGATFYASKNARV